MSKLGMEEIYPPESYNASQHISLQDYFENFHNVFSLKELPVEINSNETEYLSAIKELMGTELSLNDMKDLLTTNSVDHLTIEGEDTKNFPFTLSEDINSTSNLPSSFITIVSDVLKVSKRQAELSEMDISKMCFGNKRSYHKKLDFPTVTTSPNLQPGSDIVLSVLVYKPVAFRFFNAKNASDKLRFNHEILVLGSNTLTDFRDSILCSSDFGLCKEVENTDADLRPLSDATSVYPSGFIFIDNVFYNDLRESSAIDYSAPIIEWAKQKRIEDLKSKSMEDVTLSSFSPRLGYPYVYMHQGDCEHIFVFADAKLVDSNDCLHSQCYPHVLRINRSSNKMCFLCTVSFAKWIIVGSDRLPQHKVFMCTNCCNSYNYLDGKKLGKFRLYPYNEKHVVV